MEYKYGQFLPEIDNKICSKCSLCFQLCPGIDIENFCTDKDVTVKDLSGPCIESYIAHTKNHEIRDISTSGGIITDLIIELIKIGKFDQAFVLEFDKFDGNPARLKSVNKTDDIINASKSKYIPASVKNIIETLKNKDGKRYIIVGTSCQILGIKKFISESQISEKNLLFLGLFCDKTLNFNIIRYFEDKYKKENEKLIKFDFRNKNPDWPGDCKLYFSSGRDLKVDRSERTELKRFFQLNRCLFCLDKFNKNADISFGDCYIENKKSPLGKSVLIVRTKKGKKILDEHSYLFEQEKVDLEQIEESQKLINRKQNMEFNKILFNENNVFGVKQVEINKQSKRELSKLNRNLNLGKKYKKNTIKIKKFISKFKLDKFLFYFFGLLKIIFSKKSENQKKNIVIVGGGLLNKGAQAMVFATINQIKRKFPTKDIYLFSSLDYNRNAKQRSIYNFKILPWENKNILNLLVKNKKQNHLNLCEKEISEVLNNSLFIIDISGYGISSKLSFYRCLNFLLSLVIAKKFSIPYYMFPQSIGPLNFTLKEGIIFYPLMLFTFKYPEIIYVREDKGLKDIKKFTNKNVKKSFDIVLREESYTLDYIFRDIPKIKKINIKPDSVGIIPSVMIFNYQKMDEIYLTYKEIIDELLSLKKNVYIFYHSSEDIGVCNKIKSLYLNNEKVKLIQDDLNAIELEKIIEQFDFIIASRYHSVIHAFKNGTPALVIGWADKYNDLLKNFKQLDYHIDVENFVDKNNTLIKLNEIIKNYNQESKCIITKMNEIKKDSII